MALPFIQANTNGRLHAADEPSIAPLNRGFLYGDAIYEVWRTHGGVIVTWDEHYDRLERSAVALHLALPWRRGEMRTQVLRTAAAYRQAANYTGELYIRVQVTRGGGPIGLDVALADRADFVLLVQPCPVNSLAVQQRGLRLSLATGSRRNPVESLNPAWKTGNYLNNILGLQEARARGADDVVMLNLRGEVTEASTSNIAFVGPDGVVTPRLEEGILGGITRALVLTPIAPAVGVPVREAVVRATELSGMSECFLMSTTKDISPVTAIDGVNFKVGPETVTARISAAFADYARQSAAAHPELRT